MMEQEIQAKEIRDNQADPQLTASLNLYNARKAQQEAVNELKDKRQTLIKEGVIQFKQQKQEQKQIINEEFEKYLVEKREEVNKAREISKLIHGEQKDELDRNLQAFLNLNKEEKSLRKELVEKQVEVDYKEKYLKKVNVLQQHKNRILKREEQQLFVNAFAQAKNLIEKQMKIGNKIKAKQIEKKVKHERVNRLKEDATAKNNLPKQALRSVLYDNQMIVDQQDYEQNPQSRSFIQVNKSSKRTLNYNTVIGTTELTQDDTMGAGYHQSKNSRVIAKSAGKYASNQNNRSYILPPLHDSSFQENSNSNNNFYSKQQTNQTLNQHSYDLSREIHEIYKTTVPNRIGGGGVQAIGGNLALKKNYQRPIFAEESYPLIKSTAMDNSRMNFSFDYSKVSGRGNGAQMNLSGIGRDGQSRRNDIIDIRNNNTQMNYASNNQSHLIVNPQKHIVQNANINSQLY